MASYLSFMALQNCSSLQIACRLHGIELINSVPRFGILFRGSVQVPAGPCDSHLLTRHGRCKMVRPARQTARLQVQRHYCVLLGLGLFKLFRILFLPLERLCRWTESLFLTPAAIFACSSRSILTPEFDNEMACCSRIQLDAV